MTFKTLLISLQTSYLVGICSNLPVNEDLLKDLLKNAHKARIAMVKQQQNKYLLWSLETHCVSGHLYKHMETAGTDGGRHFSTMDGLWLCGFMGLFVCLCSVLTALSLLPSSTVAINCVCAETDVFKVLSDARAKTVMVLILQIIRGHVCYLSVLPPLLLLWLGSPVQETGRRTWTSCSEWASTHCLQQAAVAAMQCQIILYVILSSELHLVFVFFCTHFANLFPLPFQCQSLASVAEFPALFVFPVGTWMCRQHTNTKRVAKEGQTPSELHKT